MSNVPQKVMAHLKIGPATRSEISMHIDEVTSRAVLDVLNKLRANGFVKRTGPRNRPTHHFIKDDGFLIECSKCKTEYPCWAIKKGQCRHCRCIKNKSTQAQKNEGTSKKSDKPREKSLEEKLCIPYHRLLRGERIGMASCGS